MEKHFKFIKMQPVPDTSTIDNTANTNEQKGLNLKGKLKSLKSLIKFPSFNKTTQNPQQQNDKTNSQNIEVNLPQENKAEQTWKDKLENKIISAIEIEKNIKVFILLICLGFFLIFISLFLLPQIILNPSKFSMCFAFGSILILISFLFLHGTKKYFKSLFSKNRFLYTKKTIIV